MGSDHSGACRIPGQQQNLHCAHHATHVLARCHCFSHLSCHPDTAQKTSESCFALAASTIPEHENMTTPGVCLWLQVYKVFAQLCPALGLRVGLASGKLPLALEAEVLVDQSADEPCCAVNVLVATPGRLMSHLQGTPGIHLDALQMLVCISPVILHVAMLYPAHLLGEWQWAQNGSGLGTYMYFGDAIVSSRSAAFVTVQYCSACVTCKTTYNVKLLKAPETAGPLPGHSNACSLMKWLCCKMAS